MASISAQLPNVEEFTDRASFAAFVETQPKKVQELPAVKYLLEQFGWTHGLTRDQYKTILEKNSIPISDSTSGLNAQASRFSPDAKPYTQEISHVSQINIYSPFAFSLNDKTFTTWLSSGMRAYSVLQDGNWVAPTVAFQAVVKSGKFHGRDLSRAQMNYLVSLFRGEKIIFDAHGRIVSPVRRDPYHTSATNQQRLDQFFKACKRDAVRSPNDYVATRILDTGTDVTELESLLRGIQSPEELAQFKQGIELDFRSSGRGLEEMISDETEGRVRGRLLAITHSASLDSQHYLGMAYKNFSATLSNIAAASQGETQNPSALKEMTQSLANKFLKPENQPALLAEPVALTQTEYDSLAEHLASVDNPALIVTLLVGLQTLARQQQVFNLFQTTDMGAWELFRERPSSTFVPAFTDFAATYKSLLIKLAQGQVVTKEEHNQLNKALALVEQEFAIITAQEKEGLNLVDENFNVVEHVSYQIEGTCVAILGTGSMLVLAAPTLATAPVVGTGAVGGMALLDTVGLTNLAGAMLVGGTEGTLVESAVRLIYDKDTSLKDIVHSSAQDSFGATLSFGAGTLAAPIRNGIVRSVVVSNTVGFGNQVLAGTATDFGYDDFLLHSASGMLGGVMQPHLAGLPEITFEMSREFTEGLAQEQFLFEGKGVRSATYFSSAGGAVSELAGSMRSRTSSHTQNFQEINTTPPVPPSTTDADFSQVHGSTNPSDLDPDEIDPNEDAGDNPDDDRYRTLTPTEDTPPQPKPIKRPPIATEVYGPKINRLVPKFNLWSSYNDSNLLFLQRTKRESATGYLASMEDINKRIQQDTHLTNDEKAQYKEQIRIAGHHLINTLIKHTQRLVGEPTNYEFVLSERLSYLDELDRFVGQWIFIGLGITNQEITQYQAQIEALSQTVIEQLNTLRQAQQHAQQQAQDSARITTTPNAARLLKRLSTLPGLDNHEVITQLENLTAEDRFSLLYEILSDLEHHDNDLRALQHLHDPLLKDLSADQVQQLTYLTFENLKKSVAAGSIAIILSHVWPTELLSELVYQYFDSDTENPDLDPEALGPLSDYIFNGRGNIPTEVRDTVAQRIKPSLQSRTTNYIYGGELFTLKYLAWLAPSYTTDSDQKAYIVDVVKPLVNQKRWKDFFVAIRGLDPVTQPLCYRAILALIEKNSDELKGYPELSLFAARLDNELFARFVEPLKAAFHDDATTGARFVSSIFANNLHTTNRRQAADLLYDFLTRADKNTLTHIEAYLAYDKVIRYASEANRQAAMNAYQANAKHVMTALSHAVVTYLPTIVDCVQLVPSSLDAEMIRLMVRCYDKISLRYDSNPTVDISTEHDHLTTYIESLLAARPDLAQTAYNELSRLSSNTLQNSVSVHTIGHERKQLALHRAIGITLAASPVLYQAVSGDLIATMASRPQLNAYHMMIALKELIYRKPEIINLTELLTGIDSLSTDAKSIYLAEVIETWIGRSPQRLSANDWEIIRSIFGNTPRFKYFCYYLAGHALIADPVRVGAKTALAALRETGAFHFHDSVAQILKPGSPNVLIVNSQNGGMGDELIFTTRLIQSLLLNNPQTKVTVYSSRPWLYNHPQVISRHIDSLNVEEHSDSTPPYTAIFENTNSPETHFTRDSAPIYAQARLTRYTQNYNVADQRFSYDILSVEKTTFDIKSTWAESSVYDPQFRLLAELGLPTTNAQEAVPVVSGNLNSDTTNAWDSLMQSNIDNRPTLLLSAFGNELEKGYTLFAQTDRFNREAFVSLVRDLVNRGYHVMINPDSNRNHRNVPGFGTPSEIKSILSTLPQDVLSHIATIDDAILATPGALDFIVSQVNHVVAVEGGMVHNAVLQRRDTSVIMVPFGFSSGTSAWITNHPMSRVQIITGLDIQQEIPHANTYRSIPSSGGAGLEEDHEIDERDFYPNYPASPDQSSENTPESANASYTPEKSLPLVAQRREIRLGEEQINNIIAQNFMPQAQQIEGAVDVFLANLDTLPQKLNPSSFHEMMRAELMLFDEQINSLRDQAESSPVAVRNASSTIIRQLDNLLVEVHLRHQMAPVHNQITQDLELIMSDLENRQPPDRPLTPTEVEDYTNRLGTTVPGTITQRIDALQSAYQQQLDQFLDNYTVFHIDLTANSLVLPLRRTLREVREILYRLSP